MMKILMVTPELDPFVKVGGLSDAVSALTREIGLLGQDVRVVCPKYSFLGVGSEWESVQSPLEVNLGKPYRGFSRLWMHKDPRGFIIYFVEQDKYFSCEEIYENKFDNIGKRFAFLCRAAIDVCYKLNWIPDVIHCHDWTTGLIPVYLNTTEKQKPLENTACVFTIHNMRHQGMVDRDVIGFAGLPESVFRENCLEALGLVNMMKGALYEATKITTVSQTYAQEIQMPEMGCGLDPVVQLRSLDLEGIVNGIDTELWNPLTDPYLPQNYKAGDVEGKYRCKSVLQETFELNISQKTPLFGVIARLYEQKGLDLLADIVPRLLEEVDLQIVLLGKGDLALEEQFIELSEAYQHKLGIKLGYDMKLAHLIEAGSDFFLMPSRFEPCGLNQMYSMRYGAVPIVRATGGLVDTVEAFKGDARKGTGICFYEANYKALYYAILEAYSLYSKNFNTYRLIQERGMRRNFSWDTSARKYLQVYEQAIKARAKRLSTFSSSNY